MEFFETYYYANIVHNVLTDTTDYCRNLYNWHEDKEVGMFLQPFPKWSVLHEFAQYIIEDLMYEALDKVPFDAVANNSRTELWVDRALKYHGIETLGFRGWLKQQNIDVEDATQDDAYDYHQDLRLTGELDVLLSQLSNEVFYVLFGNRALLAKLNGYIAGVVSNIDKDGLSLEDEALLQKDGMPARVYMPEWARRAVYFRDRGMCATCNTDLTGLVSVSSVEHYDHIVSLAEGGINDVTNLQLLCSACNLKKGRRLLPTSTRYQAWYSHDAFQETHAKGRRLG
jgi:hypothetical protein